MSFREYLHVERYGNDEVQSIELGECYIFPKLDGTNASIWSLDLNGRKLLRGGSRHRELSLDKDNAGFLNAVSQDRRFLAWVAAFPHLRLYGEWLVPHTLKTYRDDAWRKFWVFDVFNDGTQEYVAYNDYKPLLEEFDIDYVPPLAIVKNGQYDQFIHVLERNNFFIKEGHGNGEGIVLKNYHFYNKHGRQAWAKIVTAEFKEAHHREMGPPETEKRLLEEDIAEHFVTKSEVDKTYAKIALEGWSSKKIPELLNRVFYDTIRENSWDMVKDNGFPTINYKTLRHFVFAKVKQELPEVF